MRIYTIWELEEFGQATELFVHSLVRKAEEGERIEIAGKQLCPFRAWKSSFGSLFALSSLCMAMISSFAKESCGGGRAMFWSRFLLRLRLPLGCRLQSKPTRPSKAPPRRLPAVSASSSLTAIVNWPQMWSSSILPWLSYKFEPMIES